MENTDLFREKTYNGNLNIGQQKVSLETDKPFKKIEIQYYGKMNIQSLLPNNYSLKNNILEKKIIIKSGGSEKLNPDLFKYRGKAIIKKCILYLESGKKYTAQYQDHVPFTCRTVKDAKLNLEAIHASKTR